MTTKELREEIAIELELMATTAKEVHLLLDDLSGREPTVREKTAAAAFIAQFYGGVENILKRIHRYYGVPMPIGESWHIEVFRRFCKPGFPTLPQLFDDALAADLSPFRKFRHVVHHGYGFQLEWDRMKEGLEAVENVHDRLVIALTEFMQKLPT
jgi:hypothetical protein